MMKLHLFFSLFTIICTRSAVTQPQVFSYFSWAHLLLHLRFEVLLKHLFIYEIFACAIFHFESKGKGFFFSQLISRIVIIRSPGQKEIAYPGFIHFMTDACLGCTRSLLLQQSRVQVYTVCIEDRIILRTICKLL